MKPSLCSISSLTTHLDLYDELPFWSAPFGIRLLDKINYRRGITALDIGFGTGFPLIELAMRLGSSCTVYGIDPSTDIIPLVEKKIAALNITNIRLITGVAESIPLPDRSVDLIVSNNGINNVSDIDAVFGECARILKPGSQFTWTMNTDATMMEFYSRLEQALAERDMRREIEAMRRHIELKRPPVERLLHLLQVRGFTVTEVVHDRFEYKFADGSAMFNHYFTRIAFMQAWKKLLPEDRIEEVFDAVEKWLNTDAAAAGGMRLSVPFVVVDAVRDGG